MLSIQPPFEVALNRLRAPHASQQFYSVDSGELVHAQCESQIPGNERMSDTRVDLDLSEPHRLLVDTVTHILVHLQ